MSFPRVLLPQRSRKKIICDLSFYFLSRSTETKDIIDEHGEVANNHICSPKEHILDLSINLLGYFHFDHHYISLINKKNNPYNEYCNPDHNSNPLILNQHYIIDKLKGWWSVQVSDILNQEYQVIYKNMETLEITPLIDHTPMKWNYWHFSIIWNFNNLDLNSRSQTQQKKIKRLLAGEARSVIKQFAVPGVVDAPLIPKNDFCK